MQLKEIIAADLVCGRGLLEILQQYVEKRER
jgi:hypothetical protein